MSVIESFCKNRQDELIEKVEVEKKYEEYCKGLIFYGPKKLCLPEEYLYYADVYKTAEIRKNDIWVVGHPRSGTTMMQEMVWVIANDLDFKRAKEIPLLERTIFLDWPILCYQQRQNEKLIKNMKLFTREAAEDLNERRCIKTHLPFSLLPDNLLTAGCKVIYMARNPKDVAASMFNFYDLMCKDGYRLSFAENFDLFLKGYFAYSPYFEHIKEGCELKGNENLKFVFYEDVVQRKRNTMADIGKFLGKQLTEEDLDKLIDHFNIENFKKNKAVHEDTLKYFDNVNKNRKPDYIRKGTVGDWHSYTNEELDKRADRWINENLEKIGISFPI